MGKDLRDEPGKKQGQGLRLWCGSWRGQELLGRFLGILPGVSSANCAGTSPWRRRQVRPAPQPRGFPSSADCSRESPPGPWPGQAQARVVEEARGERQELGCPGLRGSTVEVDRIPPGPDGAQSATGPMPHNHAHIPTM